MNKETRKQINMGIPDVLADPNDVTHECQALFDQLMGRAEELFGPRTAILPVRIRKSNEFIPYTWFEGGAAYIRLGAGVGLGANLNADALRQLKHQLALETVHVLSVFEGAPMIALEKGAAAYFSVDVGGYTPHESGAPAPYADAYDAVKELLEQYDLSAIRALRNPLRSINRITAAAIRQTYPNCPEHLIQRLTREWQ